MGKKDMTRTTFLQLLLTSFLFWGTLQAAEHSFKVEKVTGDVTFRAYKSFKRLTVKVGDELGAKGKIALNDGDFLEIKTPMGDVLTFENKTYATLSKLTGSGADKNVQIDMPLGKINCDVKKLSKASSFQVRTPSAVAGVRGTRFGVKIDQSGTVSVDVSEGLVAVAPASNPGSTVAVGAGQSASVKKGGGVSVSKSSNGGGKKNGATKGKKKGQEKKNGGNSGGGDSGGGDSGGDSFVAPEIVIPEPPIDIPGLPKVDELREDLQRIEFEVKK